MARRRRRNTNLEVERDTPDIATRSVLNLDLSPLRTLVAGLEDRRRWSPEPEKARGLSKKASAIVARPKGGKRSRRSLMPDVFGFGIPEKVSVCVRRKTRREVIFAKRKAGKGSRAPRRRRNEFSDVSCR